MSSLNILQKTLSNSGDDTKTSRVKRNTADHGKDKITILTSRSKHMKTLHKLALAVVAVLGLGFAVPSAQAHDRHWGHSGHYHGHVVYSHHHYWGGPTIVYGDPYYYDSPYYYGPSYYRPYYYGGPSYSFSFGFGGHRYYHGHHWHR
jgi:hypothetical protein